MSEAKYFNLIEDDIASLLVERVDNYSCVLKDLDGNIYSGFILAKSNLDNAFTVCDVDFQKSNTDRKYQSRLTFRRTDNELRSKKVRADVVYRIVPFRTGDDGYRQFWKMINFLKKFNELVDTGEFDDQYQVLTNAQFKDYLDNKKRTGELASILDDIDADITLTLQSVAVIKILKKHKEMLEKFVDEGKNETDVQNWLDEKEHAYRKERAMIFGLEFINHKREGGVDGNRYDILTRIGSSSKERVLIELKSPGDDIFAISSHETVNDESTEYSLTPSVSRAIPQILEYKRLLEEKHAGDPDLERVGETERVYIAKCIIVIGSHGDSERWLKNLYSLRNSLNSNLEIWTYTDLINKLDSTILNLGNESSNEIIEEVSF